MGYNIYIVINKKSLNKLSATAAEGRCKMLNVFKSNQSTINGGKNQIAQTAQLTMQSTAIAEELLERLKDWQEADADALISNTWADYAAMDEYLQGYAAIDTRDWSWLKEAGDEVGAKMLKSQQSKKSRARAGELTYTNYKTYLIAAIAELGIRDAFRFEKSAAGRVSAATLELTEEAIAMYTEDQVALNKAIRNVQSKKSIAKKKGISEESEEWQQLLTFEAGLKSLRTTGAVDTETKKKAEKAEVIEAMLSEVDPDNMKKAELAAKVNELKMMLSAI